MQERPAHCGRSFFVPVFALHHLEHRFAAHKEATKRVAGQATERAMSALDSGCLTRICDDAKASPSQQPCCGRSCYSLGQWVESQPRLQQGAIRVSSSEIPVAKEHELLISIALVLNARGLALEKKCRDTGASTTRTSSELLSTRNQNNDRRNDPKNEKTANGFCSSFSCNQTKATLLRSASRPLPSPSSEEQTGYDGTDNRQVLR
jgi:hypothetical protein